jgi:hypothetical protein
MEVSLLGGVLLIGGVVGLIALAAPPNTWDAMTYHLARVAHWTANGSVAHYTTNLSRQLFFSPWAEFAVLHFQVLSGGDRLANSVQWFSMAGSLIGVSLIARELGAGRRGQLFATALCAAIPMGILQGSSTQNDYVASFWLVAVAYFVLAIGRRGFRTGLVAGCGAALGLAVLTKPTAYLFGLPFCLWLTVWLVCRPSWRAWGLAVSAAALALALNAGHFTRNWLTFGSPLGPGGLHVNDNVTGPIVLSNVLRNASLHLATPSVAVNAATVRILTRIHAGLGLDIQDPRSTWANRPFSIPLLSNHEDTAANPIHFLLLLLSAGILMASKGVRQGTRLAPFLAAVLAGFVLFCALLKWQEWHSRLHLPFFVLAAACTGATLSRVAAPRLALGLVTLTLLASLPWVAFNLSRPLLFSLDVQALKEGRLVWSSRNIWNTSRIDKYFNNRPDLREPYVAAAQFLKSRGCLAVGLDMGGDSWEYPLWVLLQEGQTRPVRLNQILNQPGGNWAEGGWEVEVEPDLALESPPEVIVTLDQEYGPVLVWQGHRYSKRWSQPPLAVFVKD